MSMTESLSGNGLLDLDGPRAIPPRGTVSFLPEPVAPPIWYPFISVDDHLLEPPTLFEGRVPQHLKDEVPQMRTGFDGHEGVPYWHVDGIDIPIGCRDGASGRPIGEWRNSAQKYTDFRPGVSDSRIRLKDMDLVGLWSTLCFPSTVFGFAGRRLAKMRNQEAGFAAVQAYNDWVIEEWCAPDPARFIPCQLPWLADPRLAAQEIYRNAERGFRAVSFSENPSIVGFSSIHSEAWDPFFAACEETGTAINLHVGSSGLTHQPDPASPSEVLLALFPVNGLTAAVDWLYARVPLRFPRIKIVLSEGGVSWVPMVIERLRRTYRQIEASQVWQTSDPDPVEVLRRNFFFTSIEDPSAFHNLDVIGVDNVMVECDYPHGDSTWPDSQTFLKRDLEHLDADTLYKVCIGNAVRIYECTPPPAGWNQ